MPRISALLAVVLLLAATAAGPEQRQVALPPEIAEELKGLDLRWRFMAELLGKDVEFVPRKGVREDGIVEALEWVRSMVRPGWMPQDLKDRLRGQMLYPPSGGQRLETLGAEFALGGGRFLVVQEFGEPGHLMLLWENPSIQAGPDPGKTALLLAQCLLQIPDDHVSALTADLRPTKEGGKVYWGHIRSQKARKGDPRWFEEIAVWLADGYAYFSLHNCEVVYLKGTRARMRPSPFSSDGDI